MSRIASFMALWAGLRWSVSAAVLRVALACGSASAIAIGPRVINICALGTLAWVPIARPSRSGNAVMLMLEALRLSALLATVENASLHTERLAQRKLSP